MNKKTIRGNLRAPTTKPTATITPSPTLALDGEFPLSASNGVSAPEPLAAHDVLQAALAPREVDASDTGAHADADAAAPAADATDATPAASGDAAVPAPEQSVAIPAKGSVKKTGKKPAKAADPIAEATKPAKAPKAAKDKFVKVTFSLPESEMLVLDALKKTHQVDGVSLKKNQLLRAALLALADVDAARLAQLVAHLPAEPAAAKKKK